MNRFLHDNLYASFRQAADVWLEKWNMLQGGCLHLSEGLSELPAETREEWEKMALSCITTCHCGKCNADAIDRIHKLIVKRVLEDIQEVREGSEIHWQIIPAKRRKIRKKRPEIYQNWLGL